MLVEKCETDLWRWFAKTHDEISGVRGIYLPVRSSSTLTLLHIWTGTPTKRTRCLSRNTTFSTGRILSSQQNMTRSNATARNQARFSYVCYTFMVITNRHHLHRHPKNHPNRRSCRRCCYCCCCCCCCPTTHHYVTTTSCCHSLVHCCC